MRAQASAHTISLDQVDVEALFWAAQDGALIAAAWAEGFLNAIMLRTDAWDRLLKSKREGYLLLPILAFCRDENGEPLLDITRRTKNIASLRSWPSFPPATARAAYWRGKGPKQISITLPSGSSTKPAAPQSRKGNDPCPCGPGKKLKKRCGKAA